MVENGLLFWLAAMAFVVAFGCLNGRITMWGMLAHDDADKNDGSPAPERLQMLIGFLIALWTYANEALTRGVLDVPVAQRTSFQFAAMGFSPAQAPSHATHMLALPDVSPQFIALFAASHSIYLVGKWGRHLIKDKQQHAQTRPAEAQPRGTPTLS